MLKWKTVQNHLGYIFMTCQFDDKIMAFFTIINEKCLLVKFQREGKDRFNEDHGLVFRSFIYLFDELKARSEDATFVIKASYLEIYNEKVSKRSHRKTIF